MYKRYLNKQIVDSRYEKIFEPGMNGNDYKYKTIDLSDPNEFITRI
jgi:hypothetical protein